MKTLFLICANFVIILGIYPSTVMENRSRFDNYRIYRVYTDTEEQVKALQDVDRQSDSFKFYGNTRKPGHEVHILVPAHMIAVMSDLLETFKMKHDVLIYNLQEKIDTEDRSVMPKGTTAENFDWDHYFQLDTIYAWMDKMAEDFEQVSVLNMGNSHQGNPIKGLRIGSNPNNTAVFIESGIHAREWIAPATATFIINELLTSNDETIKKYATNFNWIIFPVINVDGYLYTFSGDRMWRKNRNVFGTCRGVDLNRNFAYHWNSTGSGSEQCKYNYAGPSADSEAETQRLTAFLRSHVVTDRIKTYIALHSYSQLIMFPYGSAEKAHNFDDLKAIGLKAAETIEQVSGRKYRSGSMHESLYPISGCSQDWVHSILKIPIAFTFELRGPQTSTSLFILPSDEIKATGEEAFAAVITILREANSLGYY